MITQNIQHIQYIEATADEIRIGVEGEARAARVRMTPCSVSPAPSIEVAARACGRELRMPRYGMGRDLLCDRVEVEGARGPRFVTRLSGAANWEYPFPNSRTIKGLQISDIADALELGVGHAAHNVNQGNIMKLVAQPGDIVFPLDGHDYIFDRAQIEALDERLRTLSRHGIVLSLILLNSPRWSEFEQDPALWEIIRHPAYDAQGFISAFNLVTPEALGYYKAFVEFLARRYMRPDGLYGRACGLIISNEVDSQFVWGNAGEMDVARYMAEHTLALRTAYLCARKYYANARVYLSLDHMWNRSFDGNPLRTYKGRDVLEQLRLNCERDGDFGWNLAYHPYPEDMGSDFWNNKTATDSFDTPRITFKNLPVLVRFMSQPEYLFEGRQRRIILSEQGFNTLETEESERTQAAAYCLAYRIVRSLPQIDSFILHAHVDNRDEFGLNLGIWRRDKDSERPNKPGTKKPIWWCFRDVDGPEHEQVVAFAKRMVPPEYWV